MSDAPPAGGYAGRAAAGVLWTSAQKWVGRVSGVVTIAVLTRLLSPEDFGTVAVAMAILPFVNLLADFGFSTYLVQAERPTERTYGTAFWYAATAGLALGAALWCAGPLVEALLGAEGIAPVVAGFAPAVILVALGSVPLAILRRRMRFRELAVQGFAAGVLGQAVAIALALAGLGVWALVAQTVITQAVTVVLAWASARWRPRLEFSGAEFAAMLRFGSGVAGVQVVAMLRLWAENTIVVLALGVTGLGYLSIAQRLIQVAQDLAPTSITPVSTVVFAQIRAQRDRLASAYARAQATVYALVIPLMLLIVVGGPQLVPLLFGAQWTSSVLPAQALAVAGMLTVGASLDHGLFHGVGRPGVWLAYAIGVEAVTVLATFLAAPHGLPAVAVCFVGVAVAATLARWPLTARVLGVPWWRLGAPFVRALGVAALVAVAGSAVAAAARPLPDLPALVLIGAAVAVASAAGVWLLLPAAARELRDLAAGLVRRIRRRTARRAVEPAAAFTGAGP